MIAQVLKQNWYGHADLISCCLQVKTGVPAEQALMVLVPEAYRNHPDLVKNYPEVCCSFCRCASATTIDNCTTKGCSTGYYNWLINARMQAKHCQQIRSVDEIDV
jgi:hypothetical protein